SWGDPYRFPPNPPRSRCARLIIELGGPVPLPPQPPTFTLRGNPILGRPRPISKHFGPRRRPVEAAPPAGGQAAEVRLPAGLALEAVDALGAAAVQPALDVLDHHPTVPARAFERDRPVRHVDPDRIVLGPGHFRGRSPPRADELLEGIRGRLHVKDVGDPGAD